MTSRLDWSEQEKFGDVPTVPPKPITSPQEIVKTILANLVVSADFVVDPNVPEEKFLQFGKLFRNFTLSDCRKWIGYPRNHSLADPVVLAALDSIAKQGTLMFFAVGQWAGMDLYDCGFRVEVGKATKSFEGQVGPRYSEIRFFADSPLRKNEHDKYSIFNVSRRVKKSQKAAWDSLAKRYGRVEIPPEGKIFEQSIKETLALQKEVKEAIDSKKE